MFILFGEAELQSGGAVWSLPKLQAEQAETSLSAGFCSPRWDAPKWNWKDQSPGVGLKVRFIRNAVGTGHGSCWVLQPVQNNLFLLPGRRMLFPHSLCYYRFFMRTAKCFPFHLLKIISFWNKIAVVISIPSCTQTGKEMWFLKLISVILGEKCPIFF